MKKYYLITFTSRWNDQQVLFNTEVIDVSPMEYIMKWKSGVSNRSGVEMYYEQHLLNQMEITEEEYKAFNEKYQ